MVFRINPNQQPLWRNPFEMQLGTGANSVVLNKLSPAQERLIAALYRGIADEQLPLITKQLGLTNNETQVVIDQVGPVMLAEPPKSKLKNHLTDDFVAGAFAEIIRASLTHGVDGESVLIARGERRVHIEELGKTGLIISQALASAGVGNLISHDELQVDKGSLGPTGFPSQLIGRPRIDAVRSMLAASPNKCLISSGKKLTEKQLEKIDCAILIAQQVIEPRRYSAWMNRDVPHLSIVFDAESVSISPMVIPGQTACLFCLENMRTDENPNWPVLATQLFSSTKRFDDSASQLFAAGVAVQKILARLDLVAGFEFSAENLIGYKLILKTGEITEFQWSKHQACQCV